MSLGNRAHGSFTLLVMSVTSGMGKAATRDLLPWLVSRRNSPTAALCLGLGVVSFSLLHSSIQCTRGHAAKYLSPIDLVAICTYQ